MKVTSLSLSFRCGHSLTGNAGKFNDPPFQSERVFQATVRTHDGLIRRVRRVTWIVPYPLLRVTGKVFPPWQEWLTEACTLCTLTSESLLYPFQRGSVRTS